MVGTENQCEQKVILACHVNQKWPETFRSSGKGAELSKGGGLMKIWSVHEGEVYSADVIKETDKMYYIEDLFLTSYPEKRGILKAFSYKKCHRKTNSFLTPEAAIRAKIQELRSRQEYHRDHLAFLYEEIKKLERLKDEIS